MKKNRSFPSATTPNQNGPDLLDLADEQLNEIYGAGGGTANTGSTPPPPPVP